MAAFTKIGLLSVLSSKVRKHKGQDDREANIVLKECPSGAKPESIIHVRRDMS